MLTVNYQHVGQAKQAAQAIRAVVTKEVHAPPPELPGAGTPPEAPRKRKVSALLPLPAHVSVDVPHYYNANSISNEHGR